MRNKWKPNPGLPGQQKEASTHLCIDKMCSECASRDTNRVVDEGDAYIDDGWSNTKQALMTTSEQEDSSRHLPLLIDVNEEDTNSSIGSERRRRTV